MTDYDKAGRYLIKRDPSGFFRWLLRGLIVVFHAWIDARRHALPDQGDLTNDLVAAFRVRNKFEALCVELQAESEADTTRRVLLGYVPRLLSEPADEDSLVLSAAGGVVINFKGRPQSSTVEQRPTIAPNCWLTGSIEQRSLREEDAATTIAAIARGDIGPWLLGWLPLMRGGANAVTIEAWKHEAVSHLSERDRAILAGLTLTFADLAKCRAEWQHGLEGWNVIKSPYLEELREQVRADARAEGKAEGKAEALREMLLRYGRQRFGKAPGRKQKADLDALSDPARLQRLFDRVFESTSWTDLLATP